MHTLGLTQCAAIALVAAACQSAVAQSGRPIRNIQVDVAPLRENAGEPTASWVQQGLPDQLARDLAGRMTAQGGTLVVRIDYVTLGPIKDSSAWDNISGVAMIGGAQWPVRATSRYQVSAVDQVRFEESNHRRVTRAMQALTFWLAKDL
jgi:hypothetical protein